MKSWNASPPGSPTKSPRSTAWCSTSLASRPAPSSGNSPGSLCVRAQHDAAPVVARLEICCGTVWLQRGGQATDQCVIHAADQLRMRLGQGVERAIDQHDLTAFDTWLVAVPGKCIDVHATRRGLG